MKTLGRDQYTISDSGLEAHLTGEAVTEFETQVSFWMLEKYVDHVDALTGEVNLTLLAEEAADVFGLIVPEHDERLHPGNDVPEDVFDWAVDVESTLVMLGKVEAI